MKRRSWIVRTPIRPALTRPTSAWSQDAKCGIFIHPGLYSVPAYAPVLPGRLAYSGSYWNALTGGKGEM